MPNYAMRGAIIEFKGGPIFIKMTGPIDDVTKSAPDFDKTMQSGQASRNQSESSDSSILSFELAERELNIFRMSLSPPIET